MKANPNRINLIIESMCKGDITKEQMINLINKYGVEE